LQHINDLSLHIELSPTICKAEGIFYQLMSVADLLPNDVRKIIGLEPLDKRTATNDDDTSGNNCRVSETGKNSRRNGSNSANVTLGHDEVSFERGLYLSYT